ncbi:hypothetical protein BDZ91DRAFT_732532 [Kalaharituber pfeilii]|nr:hypothetical protein BDZ91DRAFT_732532 [Kalaharituber pfeilii]
MNAAGGSAGGRVGKRLLGEIVEEDFTEFLSSLRSTTATILASPTTDSSNAPPPYYSCFHIPILDRFVNPLLQLHQQQYLASKEHPRQQYQPFSEYSNAAPTPVPAPFPFPLIELASTSPCAGKTQLLYLICAVAVLPRTYTVPFSSPSASTVILNGKHSAIIIMDCDARLNLSRLASIMRLYILSHLPPDLSSHPSSSPHWIGDLIHSSLQHIHIFHRAGGALPNLSNEEELSQHAVTPPPPQLQETYANPMAALAATYQPLVAQLNALQRLLGCWVLVTRRMNIVQQGPQGLGPTVLLSPMPAVWSGVVMLRVVVDREMRERWDRMGELAPAEEGDRQWFQGRVEMVGRGWGGNEVLEVLEEKDVRWFRFSIGRDRVEISGSEL